MLIRGYWNKPEATAETIVDGWLRSGDIGRLDDEGFIYVEDRAKDMVIRAGENIYCAEVEAAIYDHPAVYEAAVFGIPHARLGEELVAAVFLKAGASASTPTSSRPTSRERLAGFKVPSRVVFVDEQLPRGATGKILKRELRDEPGRGHLVSPATARADQTVLVTGANSGIGLATVLELARRGYRTVGTVRSPAKASVVHQAAATAERRGRDRRAGRDRRRGLPRTSWPGCSSTGWSTTPATP